MTQQQKRNNDMMHNFMIQNAIAEKNYAEQYLKVEEFLKNHPKSYIIFGDVGIHPDDKEDFVKVMYGDIMI